MIYQVKGINLGLNLEAKVSETKITNFSIVYELDALMLVKKGRKCDLCEIF
jgi:hypothetical protein